MENREAKGKALEFGSHVVHNNKFRNGIIVRC